MNIEDLEYLAMNLAIMCGLPVRLYKNNNRVYYYSPVMLIKDPIILELENIKNKTDEIGYITTDDFFYYSYINYENIKLVIGPSRLLPPDDKLLRKLAFMLELTSKTEDFINSMKLLTPMPLETIIQALCTLNFALNGKKHTLKDILINDKESKELDYKFQSELSMSKINDINYEKPNNSYQIEEELLRIVEHGEINELKAWVKNAPAANPGILAKDSLRQAKNIFIAFATLISRAAIKGKMDIYEALSLSDLYIQKMELLNNVNDINSLQMNMLIAYTEQVAKIKGKNSSDFLINLNKYILSHLSDSIKVADICEALYISKSSLFEKIKKETNLTLSDYILTIKINEAKTLLQYTNKSMTAISAYLGFSSQSHFNHTFKKITNETPSGYKNSHK